MDPLTAKFLATGFFSFWAGLLIGRHFLQSMDFPSMLKYEQAVKQWRARQAAEK